MGLFSQKKDLNYRVEQVLLSHTFKKPKSIFVFSACLLLTIATITTAQEYAPKINVSSIEQQSKLFSTLSRTESERLLTAVRDKDLVTVNNMIADGLDINTPIIGDGTALIVAVKHKDLQLVESLIEFGADVNQAALGDGNPLIAAAMVDSTPIANLLLANGADINAVVPADETPLINATRRGYLDMTKWLVENGADVNLKVKATVWDDFEVRSPLNMAASNEIRDYLTANNATE